MHGLFFLLCFLDSGSIKMKIQTLNVSLLKTKNEAIMFFTSSLRLFSEFE
jgi:hypothetical protein